MADSPPDARGTDDTGPLARIPSQEALADAIAAEVMDGQVLTPLRGVRGVGKTTVLRKVEERLRRSQRLVVFPAGKGLKPLAIKAAILAEAGLGSDASPASTDLLDRLWTERQVGFVVVLLDDADSLPSDAFRYLSLLLQLAPFKPVKLQIVACGLLGQWSGLLPDDLTQMRRDMVSRSLVLPWDGVDAAAYLVAKPPGSGRPRITRSGMRDLVEQAQGIPARLDALMASKPARTRRRRLSFAGRMGMRPRRAWPYAGATCIVIVLAGIWLLGGPTPNSPEPPGGTPAVGRSVATNAPSIIAPPVDPALPAVPSRIPGSEEAQPATSTPAPAVQAASRPFPAGGGPPPGLIFVAQGGDTLQSMYTRVYRGLTPPSYASVLALNRRPIQPGAMVVFPEPPDGWSTRGATLPAR